MRRRFSVAQALLGRPELILLDEPTSGLDPELVVQIRQLIAERRGQATILVSSHILSELQSLCDHAIFIENGRAVRQGSMKTVTGATSQVSFTLSREPDLEALRRLLPGCELQWNVPRMVVRTPESQTIEQTNAICLQELLNQGAGVLEVSAGQSLEQAYLDVRDRSRRAV
jgi:ABC-2 type transport system ATP-binding protein